MAIKKDVFLTSAREIQEELNKEVLVIDPPPNTTYEEDREARRDGEKV